MTPQLTSAGKNMLLRALAGDTITFTKLQIGNGNAQQVNLAESLQNPLVTMNINSIDTGTEYAVLTAGFTNSSVESGFHITEVGIFVQDPDDATSEILYALGNENESAADFVPAASVRILEMQYSVLAFVGDAENISAAISSSLTYATKAQLDAHIADDSNPHGVTKAQVGLGRVPNVATNDQTPTYGSGSPILAELESGETLGSAFGKIKTAVSHLISHLSSRQNPHSVTAGQIGAAPSTHTHSTSDINSGVLPINRGGTGASTLPSFVSSLSSAGVPRIASGAYNGNGYSGAQHSNSLSFSYTPQLLIVMPQAAEVSAENEGFVAVRGVTTLFGNSAKELHLTWNGKTVSWSGSSAVYQQNAVGTTYVYFAIL